MNKKLSLGDQILAFEVKTTNLKRPIRCYPSLDGFPGSFMMILDPGKRSEALEAEWEHPYFQDALWRRGKRFYKGDIVVMIDGWDLNASMASDVRLCLCYGLSCWGWLPVSDGVSLGRVHEAISPRIRAEIERTYWSVGEAEND
jgi:hypothetical protein